MTTVFAHSDLYLPTKPYIAVSSMLESMCYWNHINGLWQSIRKDLADLLDLQKHPKDAGTKNEFPQQWFTYRNWFRAKVRSVIDPHSA